MNRLLSCCLLLAVAVARPVPGHADELFGASPFGALARATAEAVARGANRSQGNHVQILDSGDDALLLRTHLIRNATKSICVQTFIWTNDEVGRFLMCELVEAAKRGVKVRIIADHFVSHKDPSVMASLATVHPNLQIKHYRPAAGRIKPSRLHVILKTIFWFRALNQRMHNKIMVFDDVAAITGGRNIENSYHNRSTGMNFKDRDIFVIGPVVPDMTKSFEAFWNCKHVVASRDLLDVAAVIEKGTFVRYDSRDAFVTHGLCDREDKEASDRELIGRRFVDPLVPAKRVEFIADRPGKNRTRWLRGKGAITRRLGRLVEDAGSEIVMQSPYFVLSTSTRKLFAGQRRAKPGLKVVVSSNSFGSTDNTAAYSANYKLRSCYIEELGFSVYEYKPHPADLAELFPAFDMFRERAEEEIRKGKQERGPFLCIHAKSLVIDDRVAYIGTYNLDPRSENLNTEVGLLIEDEAVAALLKASIARDCLSGNSWVIAKKLMPLSTDKVNAMFEGLMRLSPIDIWPIRNTSSFELLPGKTPVPTDHPDFYARYRDLGSFPGAPPGLSTKEITTRLYKAVGGLAIPIL